MLCAFACASLVETAPPPHGTSTHTRTHTHAHAHTHACAGTHSIVSITTEGLAGRTFPTTIRKGKGEQVVPGRGLMLVIVLLPGGAIAAEAAVAAVASAQQQQEQQQFVYCQDMSYVGPEHAAL